MVSYFKKKIQSYLQSDAYREKGQSSWLYWTVSKLWNATEFNREIVVDDREKIWVKVGSSYEPNKGKHRVWQEFCFQELEKERSFTRFLLPRRNQIRVIAVTVSAVFSLSVKTHVRFPTEAQQSKQIFDFIV